MAVEVIDELMLIIQMILLTSGDRLRSGDDLIGYHAMNIGQAEVAVGRNGRFSFS